MSRNGLYKYNGARDKENRFKAIVTITTNK